MSNHTLVKEGHQTRRFRISLLALPTFEGILPATSAGLGCGIEEPSTRRDAGAARQCSHPQLPLAEMSSGLAVLH